MKPLEIAKDILFGLFSILVITCAFALLYAAWGWWGVGIGIGSVILTLICKERGRRLEALYHTQKSDEHRHNR